MYPVTDAVKALYAAEQPQVLRITGTDKNGVSINITDANVVLGSFNIDRYSCNGNRLEVGTAIAAEMTVKLDNYAGTYNGVVFEGTELYVEIGIGNPVNWMPCGYFTPDEQPRTANQITIHALDRMVKFDNSVPGLLPWENENHEIITNEQDQPIYFMTDLAYPATVQSVIQTVCGYYHVPFTQDISGFPNYNFTISEAPNLQQPTTYRNIIQWCAGIMGTCAWIDWTGSLRFSWYGDATGYVCTPENRFSSDLHEDDVEITGVQYTNLQNYTVLAGRPEYTIDMTGNYLMAGGVTQILTSVNNALNGYTYRPFSASIINAPYLWPMDEVTFTDKDGNDHTCVLTNVNFGINGAMAIEGKGESMQAASREALSGMTKEQGVLVEQAREATKELDDSLTQEEIFNRLTDNGGEQGLILYNGKLYLNASYISAGTVSADILKGGTMTLGGLNNISGKMQILDVFGNVSGKWDVSGLRIALNTDSSNYAQFNSSGFVLMLDSGSYVKTDRLVYLNHDYYPVDINLGKLETGYETENERWITRISPGAVDIDYYERESPTSWSGKRFIRLSLDGFSYVDSIGHTSFTVNAADHTVSVNGNLSIEGNVSINSYAGASGTFRSSDNKMVYVKNGIITEIA